MSKFQLRTGPTYIRIQVPQQHYSTFNSFLIRNAATWEWDPRLRRSFVSSTFYTYNRISGSLRLPKGYYSELMLWGEEHGFTFECRPDEVIVPRKISGELAPGIQLKENQIGPAAFLMRDEIGQKGLELATGVGKTVLAINTICGLGYAAMIICSGLIDQWVDMITKMSTIRNVYVIKTFKSISNLILSEHMPDVLVCSLETLRPYSLRESGYDLLPLSFEQFMEHYGIGVKIVDEVHENYQAVAIMDLFCRVRNNIYMSATFRRSRDNENKIFNMIYPYDIRFDGGIINRYTKVTFYGYWSTIPEKKTSSKRGYNHAKFESLMLKKVTKLDHFFRTVVAQCIIIHYLNIRNPVEKCLIYFSTVDMCNKALSILKAKFPDLVIKTFIGDDKEDNVADGVDIIISTPKKSATGRDIKNLRTVINTISTNSSVLIEQMLGRLRRLNGVTPEFVSVFDQNNSSHVRHQESQRNVCIPRSCSHYIGTLY